MGVTNPYESVDFESLEASKSISKSENIIKLVLHHVLANHA